MDGVIIVNTYHHINNRIQYLKEIYNALPKNGWLCIIDFKKEELPMGPPMELKVSKQQIYDELVQAGFLRVAPQNFLQYQNLVYTRK